ncbi:hypothetical protein PC129_g19868 [Phytophthora cactorum]|uniref:Uncharacterized protein n=1 Tax=Phytophthora cactorum TaxID=29920 RepID=A0A8T1H9T7_9STRA|nr:hypothetical protein Pcac1_g24550 [Phytophthora cactorum]KAG2879965.1 hypothetical protein PC114_g22301 [Phytophthora cactorum]KAG2899858.1 hypothetical protein PC117_g22124 [Phytophthora cactorum]KAG2978059.1 hypothetical protein PC119_g21847 [Phytophthora cactorum]KAG2997185.1 hypothetical protein PC120_g21314 [Phytophthora cactorum]
MSHWDSGIYIPKKIRFASLFHSLYIQCTSPIPVSLIDAPVNPQHRRVELLRCGPSRG